MPRHFISPALALRAASPLMPRAESSARTRRGTSPRCRGSASAGRKPATDFTAMKPAMTPTRARTYYFPPGRRLLNTDIDIGDDAVGFFDISGRRASGDSSVARAIIAARARDDVGYRSLKTTKSLRFPRARLPCRNGKEKIGRA